MHLPTKLIWNKFLFHIILGIHLYDLMNTLTIKYHESVKIYTTN